MTTHRQRAEMQRLMKVLVSHKRRIHYAQIRPMNTTRIKPGRLLAALAKPGGITMDCSESVTLICRLAGLRDPNGQHYDGQGFTGTLMDHLHHYEDPASAEPGALLVMGAYPGEHVCMVVSAHKTDPMLFSHGTEADPSFYSFEVMKSAFPGKPHTFLSVKELGFSKNP